MVDDQLTLWLIWRFDDHERGLISGKASLFALFGVEKTTHLVQPDACKDFFGTRPARSRIAMLYAESTFAAWIEEEMNLRSQQASGRACYNTGLLERWYMFCPTGIGEERWYWTGF